MRILGNILLILGILGSIFLCFLLLIFVPASIFDKTSTPGSYGAVFALIFVFVALPAFLLIYFGSRIKNNARNAASSGSSPSPHTPGTPSTPARMTASSVRAKMVVCLGCGAQKSVLPNEAATCDYCGSATPYE